MIIKLKIIQLLNQFKLINKECIIGNNNYKIGNTIIQ